MLMGRLPSAVRRGECPSWTHEIVDGIEPALGLSKPHLRNGFSCRWEVSSHGNGVKGLEYWLSEKHWGESGDGITNAPPSSNR